MEIGSPRGSTEVQASLKRGSKQTSQRFSKGSSEVLERFRRSSPEVPSRFATFSALPRALRLQGSTTSASDIPNTKRNHAQSYGNTVMRSEVEKRSCAETRNLSPVLTEAGGEISRTSNEPPWNLFGTSDEPISELVSNLVSNQFQHFGKNYQHFPRDKNLSVRLHLEFFVTNT